METPAMPSIAYGVWVGDRAEELDELESAHASVGGTEPGRRHATQQLNRAYALLLAGHFQGFCRDLHTESAKLLAFGVPVALRKVVQEQFFWGRAVDRGNATPGNIGSDYNRFGITFWPLVLDDHRFNAARRDHLEDLNTWRNAIAHQDLDPTRLGGTTALRLAVVRRWRNALDGLAASFDGVMRRELANLLGASPW